LALTLERAQGERSRNILVLLALGARAVLWRRMITPAISVLSAVEGIGVATPALNRFVLPLTVRRAARAFSSTKRGTGPPSGKHLRPVMVLWFTVIAIIGVMQIAETPRVLGALNPRHATHILSPRGAPGSSCFGAVRLAITGGEAALRRYGAILAVFRSGWHGSPCGASRSRPKLFGQGA